MQQEEFYQREHQGKSHQGLPLSILVQCCYIKQLLIETSAFFKSRSYLFL